MAYRHAVAMLEPHAFTGEGVHLRGVEGFPAIASDWLPNASAMMSVSFRPSKRTRRPRTAFEQNKALGLWGLANFLTTGCNSWLAYFLILGLVETLLKRGALNGSFGNKNNCRKEDESFSLQNQEFDPSQKLPLAHMNVQHSQRNRPWGETRCDFPGQRRCVRQAWL